VDTSDWWKSIGFNVKWGMVSCSLWPQASHSISWSHNFSMFKWGHLVPLPPALLWKWEIIQVKRNCHMVGAKCVCVMRRDECPGNRKILISKTPNKTLY
jgi:hypothetical protein